ncbi:hypothetical protein E8E15_002447 [Penicillium rubens]|nr:hypothetical protein E8E15_002447 [Penicillium rubens]
MKPGNNMVKIQPEIFDMESRGCMQKLRVVEVVPDTFGVFDFGSLLTGLGFGCVYISTDLLCRRVRTPKLRGYGMSFHKSPYNIAWRVSHIIQPPIGLAFIVVSFWYTESPRYMLEKHPEMSERALQILR